MSRLPDPIRREFVRAPGHPPPGARHPLPRRQGRVGSLALWLLRRTLRSRR